jgi:hypothetical protein
LSVDDVEISSFTVEQENSHIITEHSAPELVEKVEREFKPVRKFQPTLAQNLSVIKKLNIPSVCPL